MRVALVVVACLLDAATGRAERPPIHRYVTTMVGYQYVLPSSGIAPHSFRTSSEHLLLSRFAVGLEIGAPECVSTRLGATGSLQGEAWDGAPGIEVQVEYPLSPQWKIGGRVGAEYFLLRGRPVATGGVRLRTKTVSLGLDAALLGNGRDRKTSPGFVASVGLEGRAARYTVVITAGALLLAGIVAFTLEAEGD
ncbi:MAG: hypothetical protein JNL83_27095 [Myxococcales bacterium]|nr:hypothetical protein [Myxococcales bacterium]